MSKTHRLDKEHLLHEAGIFTEPPKLRTPGSGMARARFAFDLLSISALETFQAQINNGFGKRSISGHHSLHAALKALAVNVSSTSGTRVDLCIQT